MFQFGAQLTNTRAIPKRNVTPCKSNYLSTPLVIPSLNPAPMPIVYTRKRLRAPRPHSPPPQSAPSTPPQKPRRKKRKYTQLHLDAGQSDIITTCNTCGMLYAPGRDDDLHTRYHRTRTPLPRWSPITSTNHKLQHKDITIHLLNNTATPTAKRLDKFVSEVLGTVIDFPSAKWLAVAGVRRGLVCAFCLVERVATARVLEKGVLGDSVHVVMGVRKIWVDGSVRQGGVASRMLEEARIEFLYGVVVERSQIAFSPPTEDGALFARRFCGSVLVYDTEVRNGCAVAGGGG